jgi:hypothetical protein
MTRLQKVAVERIIEAADFACEQNAVSQGIVCASTTGGDAPNKIIPNLRVEEMLRKIKESAEAILEEE